MIGLCRACHNCEVALYSKRAGDDVCSYQTNVSSKTAKCERFKLVKRLSLKMSSKSRPSVLDTKL